MKTSITKTKHRGIVVILDALGAAAFDDASIDKFLKARAHAMKRLDARLKQMKGRNWKRQQFSFFTFNDTVIMALQADGRDISDQQINYFFRLVREFFIEVLFFGILFRGACATGSFLVDAVNNTILGEAVSDAAAWYDKAEWIGLITTPRTSLHLKARREAFPKRTFLCLDYDVPMKDGRAVHLKALNWRTVLTHQPFKKRLAGQSEKGWFLNCLASHQIPFSIEAKYANSLAFFDICGAVSVKAN